MSKTYNRQWGFNTCYNLLITLRQELASSVWKGDLDEDESTDVRLMYEGGEFHFAWGDVAFDARHYPHCGAGAITYQHTNKDLREVTRLLLDQIEESIAESIAESEV